MKSVGSGVSQFIVRGLRSPMTAWNAVSHAMTGASTTLVLIIIITLNVIWGYPWLGPFAACSALLLVGFVVNRLLKPRLRIKTRVPRFVQAGEPFYVDLDLHNRSQLPALELNVGFRHEFHFIRWIAPRDYIARIPPGCQSSSRHEMVYSTRGIHQLPQAYVESLFPFSLFRATVRYDLDTSLPVTPRPLADDEFSLTHPALSRAIGKWVCIASGDMMEYSGSREYQSGMPVLRWDFASWARLGRPIVREFSTQTQASVALVVDTSFNPAGGHETRREKTLRKTQRAEQLEQLLSLAATLIGKLSRHAIRVTMGLTSEGDGAVGPGSNLQSVSTRRRC